VLWTGCSVALGVFLASYEVDGRTPLEHAQRAWKANAGPEALEGIKGRFDNALENARDSLANDRKPHEHHSPEDRAAINKLIAKSAGGR
jgi:hypothetical protein